jgi:hypothetical protein
MGLTMSQREAVIRGKARAYARADRAVKSQILDELVEFDRMASRLRQVGAT